MAKWGTVFFGFILTLIVEMFFGRYEYIGLIIVGFIVGVMVHDGAKSGLWNAALAGAFGSIIGSIIFIIFTTIGGAKMGIFGGLVGITVTGVSSLFIVAASIIEYIIIMGIAGAVGGFITDRK